MSIILSETSLHENHWETENKFIIDHSYDLVVNRKGVILRRFDGEGHQTNEIKFDSLEKLFNHVNRIKIEEDREKVLEYKADPDVDTEDD